MKSRTLHIGMAISALSASAIFSLAIAQKAGGTLYALHSSPEGTCPGMDWHITLTGNNLEGFVAVNHTKRMWRLDGTVTPASADKERSFEMNAEEVGGADRKAIVKGTSGGEYVNATITGSGTPCDGKILAIPRALNGTGGGGG
jgi:hypothetical protein